MTEFFPSKKKKEKKYGKRANANHKPFLTVFHTKWQRMKVRSICEKLVPCRLARTNLVALCSSLRFEAIRLTDPESVTKLCKINVNDKLSMNLNDERKYFSRGDQLNFGKL